MIFLYENVKIWHKISILVGESIMKKQNGNNKKKILIVTAFPTHGAGSGALITTQAKS